MSLSTPKLKFLLDENVRIELFKFLQASSIDVKLSPKSASDSFLANISKREKRILVTNDSDFLLYPRSKLFAVVWLRIPQSDAQGLINSFSGLLSAKISWQGKLVILTLEGRKIKKLGKP